MKRSVKQLLSMAMASWMGIFLLAAPMVSAVNADELDKMNESGGEEVQYDCEWEVYDIGTPDEWRFDIEAAETGRNIDSGIAVCSVYDLPGTWIQEEDGRWWYRHTDGSYTRSDWERINSIWYYFDAEGYMFVGWLNLNATWYYLDESGAMQTGWIYSNGKYYYCDESGAMQTGWVYTDGKWYYCSESDNGSDGSWIDNTGTQMIQEALKYVGNPYVYGGNSLTSGTDCSGYVKLISAEFGISTPRTAASQYASSQKITYQDLQPGDLVFYSRNGTVFHVAYYMGKVNYRGTQYSTAVVNAANEDDGICVTNIEEYGSIKYYGTYWR